jgi:hypothetical protein
MDITLGGITIAGPYTLSMRSFDSMDASFTGTHSFTGTPDATICCKLTKRR